MPTEIYKREPEMYLSRIGRKYTNRKLPPPFSEEHKRKISNALKGHKMHPNARIAIFKANFGRKNTPEAKKRMSISASLSKRSPHSEETKRKIGVAHKGKIVTTEMRKRMREAHKGKELSIEHRKKISEAHLRIREKSHLWKGGITPINHKIRTSLEYRLWRAVVFRRDNYTCVWCGIKNGWSKELKRHISLEIDHIKPFAYFPELRFAIDNGRTLCRNCHKTTDTWGRPVKSTYKQMEQVAKNYK